MKENNQKRILILNWRCPKNPKAGGAEKVTLIHGKAWVEKGWKVVWLAGKFKGGKREEIIDGVKIFRFGSPVSIYFLAPFIYWFKFSGNFDLVIDQIHGIPFLSPLWAFKSKKIAFIHEVAQEIWDEMFGFPKNILGKLYERIYFHIYRNIPFWTVSPSTEKDLIKCGILKENITVIPNGVDLDPVKEVPKKEKKITLIFVSRLVKMKGVEDALKVFAEVYRENKNSQFWIVGNGEEDYISFLKNQTKNLGIDKVSIFWGYVSEKKKVELLQKAHFLIHTSVREGFGLVVLEANSQGTPAIVYDSPGLRDLVENGINGFQFKKGCYQELANKVLDFFDSKDKEKSSYFKIANSSIKNVSKYSWPLLTSISFNYLKQIDEL